MGKKFNDPDKLTKIQNNYFVRMMLPDSEKKADPYVKEESKWLRELITNVQGLNQWNFVVVGSGTLWYLDLVYENVKNYVAVEPLADVFIQKQVNFILSYHSDIHVIPNQFGDFGKEQIPSANSVFLFHFNILSYIPKPIDKINKYINKGDILYISTWNNSEIAKKSRREYFNYINNGMKYDEFKIDPDQPIGLCSLDNFPFEELKYYSSHKRIKGEVTDILIINC